MKNNILLRMLYSKRTIKKTQNKINMLGSKTKININQFFTIKIILLIFIFVIVLFASSIGYILAPIIPKITHQKIRLVTNEVGILNFLASLVIKIVAIITPVNIHIEYHVTVSGPKFIAILFILFFLCESRSEADSDTDNVTGFLYQI